MLTIYTYVRICYNLISDDQDGRNPGHRSSSGDYQPDPWTSNIRTQVAPGWHSSFEIRQTGSMTRDNVRPSS